ncbi:MAG: hypothetical protein WCV85_00065 [Patescibacteria group bacterium]|jgi:hypothetical protein
MSQEKQPITLEDLARMIKMEFDHNGEEFTGIRQQFHDLHGEIQELKDGQHAILVRLDNVAYRFEVTELERRVGILEKRAGLRA